RMAAARGALRRPSHRHRSAPGVPRTSGPGRLPDPLSPVGPARTGDASAAPPADGRAYVRSRGVEACQQLADHRLASVPDFDSGSHARRAAIRTCAGLDGLAAGADELGNEAEKALAEPNAAGH